MADVEKRNAELRAEKKNILSEPNVGDLKTHRWYTDECFAQQHFTGTNPVTIKIASDEWIRNFTKVATDQGRTQLIDLLATASKNSSLYVQVRQVLPLTLLSLLTARRTVVFTART